MSTNKNTVTEAVDIRSLVLSGGVTPLRQPLYVERLGGWYTVQELMADERANVLQISLDQTNGKLIFPVLYPALVVYCLRYARPDTPPPLPVKPVKPAPLDEKAGEEEQAAYAQAVLKYQADLAQYKIDTIRYAKYPGINGNPPHPRAGDLIFKHSDREAVARSLPGNVIEEIAMPAFAISGLNEAAMDDEKNDSAPTPNSSTATA